MGLSKVRPALRLWACLQQVSSLQYRFLGTAGSFRIKWSSDLAGPILNSLNTGAAERAQITNPQLGKYGRGGRFHLHEFTVSGAEDLHMNTPSMIPPPETRANMCPRGFRRS